MNVLTRYILKQFFRFSLMIILGLSAVFLVFDVLTNAGDVTENSSNVLQTLGHYMGLRIPGIMVLVIPIGALLGTIVIMNMMVKSSEMIIIGGAGFAIYKVARILALGACVLAMGQFGVSELLASQSNIQLRLWAEQDFKGSPPEAPETNTTLWVSDGLYILNYQRESMDGSVLYEPVLIERDKDGLIASILRADIAVYHDDGWALEGVERSSASDKPRRIKIDISLKPRDFAIPAQRYEESRFVDLWRLVFRADGGQIDGGQDVHHLWFQRKLAQPLSVILMALLAAPIGLFMARSYNGFLLSFSFVMIGFMFFISERLLLSMGESFTLPSFMAVWSSHLIFGFMVLWFMIYKQE